MYGIGSLVILLSAGLLLQPSAAVAGGRDGEFLYGFLAGRYQLVGKGLESTATYAGRVTLARGDSGLVVTREIGSRSLTGSARVETAGESVEVLRIRFAEAGVEYEETCLIGSDLDNYARLTCHLYRPGVHTDAPGLEALFIDPGGL